MAGMGDPLLGALAAELLKIIMDAMKSVSNFKPHLQHLKSTLESLLPQIKDLERLDSELDVQHRRSDRIYKLKQLFTVGKDLVLKCSNLHSLNIYQKYRYSKKILKFDKSLVTFFQSDVQSENWVLNKLLLLDIQEVKQKLDRCLTSEIRSGYGDGGGGGGFSCVVPELPSFPIGMDVPLQELKMKLFRDDVTILGLCGPGGYGKTTLATILCRDEQIKDSATLQGIPTVS